MSPPRNGAGARPASQAPAENTTINPATGTAPSHAHDIAALKHSAVLYALRLRPCGRRRNADDIVIACAACGWGHRFRGYEGLRTYTRRLPCAPSTTAHIEVTEVLPRVMADPARLRGAAA